MIIGVIKWIDRNRVNVGFLTENPPHSQDTTFLPVIGIDDIKFVMTVAPQNDICPHGRTYPINAVIIVIINRVKPVSHVFLFLNDEFINPRHICI